MQWEQPAFKDPKTWLIFWIIYIYVHALLQIFGGEYNNYGIPAWYIVSILFISVFSCKNNVKVFEPWTLYI